MTLQINTDRLLPELHHLATLTDCPPTTDPSLSPPPPAAALPLRAAAIGNTFIRFQGSDPTLPAIGTGSHTDAIPHAGMYDGTVGVLGGVEAMRALKAAGFVPRRSLELIMFTSEEPTRFGIGCVGSRALSGTLTSRKLAD